MINLYFLHGFLGLPRDWNFLTDRFGGYRLHFIHIYDQFGPIKGFQHFSEKLNAWVDPDETNILIGYSLGGRLGLHALLDKPNLWSRAAFISTHLGLRTEAEKRNRVVSDKDWAMHFLTDEWSIVMEKWNKQPVFANDTLLNRKEKDYNRNTLSDVLMHWSLGRQEDLQEKLSQFPKPIYWIVGKSDSKFSQLSNTVKLQHPDSRIVQVDQAGHRIPWDRQENFIQWIHHLVDA